MDTVSNSVDGNSLRTRLPAVTGDEQSADNEQPVWPDIRRLAGYLKPHAPKFIGGLIVAALSSSVGLVFPFLFGMIIDRTLDTGMVSSKATGGGSNLVFGVLLIALSIQAILIHLHRVWVAQAGLAGVGDLRNDLYSNVVSQPMAFFSERRVGELTSRFVADLEVIQNILLSVVPLVVLQSIYLLGGLGLLAITSLRLMMLLLLIFPILAVLGVVMGKRIRQSQRSSQDLLADSNVVVEETLQGIASVKAFSMEQHEINRYDKSVQSYTEMSLRGVRWTALFSSFVVMALCGGLVVVLWRGMHLVGAGEMSPGELTRFVLYMVLAGSAVGVLADRYGKIQKMLGATHRVCALLSEHPEPITGDQARTAGWPSKLRGDVEFENVSFRYPARPDIPVLKGLSLKVEAGQKIALVGPSGAGKSTLTSLLARFYPVQDGSVLVDGIPIERYPLHYLRRQMAIVLQEVMLFGGTIAENIGYGNPDAGMEGIIAAARKANVHEFVSGMSEGYQTIVGERGMRLSGGQKQRIVIARAMLRDPAILILDEATNALDAESEVLVQQALDTLMEKRTTFIIAHRLSTAAKADWIAVINDGTVVELGTHAELRMKDDGLYQKLSRLQFEL